MAVEAAVDGGLKPEFPFWNSFRRKFPPDSPFFTSGDLHRQLLSKQVALDLNEDEMQQLLAEDHDRSIFCPIAGCDAQLKSLEGFEDHYNARHTASCSVCSRVYPTQRLLSIHVSEMHDSFFQAKVARGFAMYECLVETCGLKFKSYKARHRHLVDKHKFPASFEFSKKVHQSKKQRQKLWRKKNSHKEEASSAMQVEDETMEGLVSAVSKLRTSDSTPSSVSFGRRHNRGLAFVPRSVQHGKSKSRNTEEI
ncbi:hypothetical protein vseg_015852 [Gypsophila vaccaria]